MHSAKVVTSVQMREVEARSEKAGVPTSTLMENAGLAVAQRVRHHLGPLVGVPIVVLVGPGNNGGDGLVAARRLHGWGASVLVYVCRDRREADPQLASTAELDLTILHRSRDQDCHALRAVLESAHMVVDAVFGAGRIRPISGEIGGVFAALAEARAARPELRLLSVDVPSGLDADTGAVDPSTVPADVTVTLGCPKMGLFAFPGANAAGLLETVDIGLPAGVSSGVAVELMGPDWAREALPDRPLGAHKGSFGRTLVVAGSRGYVGAAALAAAAATRVGAGLVTLAVPESLRDAIASRVVEPTFILLPESAPGVVSSDAAETIVERLPSFDAMLVGCGLGQAPETRGLVETLLCSGHELPSTVVDADGLNALAMMGSQGGEWWTKLPSAVLTPHPGEMARLTGIDTGAVQRDRVGSAREAAAAWNKVVVLKGAYTAVARPTRGVMLSPFANPGLASAGTGDVLAGAVAGLLSHGLGLADAAALGVYVHGLAGQRVRDRLGEMGMIASDLLEALPLAIRELREGSAGRGTD